MDTDKEGTLTPDAQEAIGPDDARDIEITGDGVFVPELGDLPGARVLALEDLERDGRSIPILVAAVDHGVDAAVDLLRDRIVR